MTELSRAGPRAASPKSLGKQMFFHIICGKILMIVVLTYSISQGPDSADIIFGIAHLEVWVYVLLYTHAHSHTWKAQ